MTTPKFTKIAAGHYATADGTLAIVAEGHGYINQDAQADGFGNDGWALVESDTGGLREDHNIGQTIDWFDTKKEAVEYAQKMTAPVANQRTDQQNATVQRIGRFYTITTQRTTPEFVSVEATGPDGFPATFSVARDGTPTRWA